MRNPYFWQTGNDMKILFCNHGEWEVKLVSHTIVYFPVLIHREVWSIWKLDLVLKVRLQMELSCKHPHVTHHVRMYCLHQVDANDNREWMLELK